MGANGDETNGHGGTGDDGDDSNDFRTPADYADLGTLAGCIGDLDEIYAALARSLRLLGPDVHALEQDQVAAFWARWNERATEADELREWTEAESLRLTKRPILKPPWHL